MFRFANLAVRYGLLASAGSDYHGPDFRYMNLGPLPAIPAECTPVWSRWVAPMAA
jgi:hypothetical protein